MINANTKVVQTIFDSKADQVFNHIFFKDSTKLLFFLSTLLISCMSLTEISLSVSMSYFIMGGSGFLIARYFKSERLYLLVFCVAVLVTTSIYYLYLNRYGVPYIGGGSDDLSYERYALSLTAHHSINYNSEDIRYIIGDPSHNSPGYIYIISLLVRIGNLLGGFHTLMPRLLNCTLLGLCSVFMSLISKQLGLGTKQANFVGLATGLFPMMPFVAAHTFRDIIVTSILILTLYLAMLFVKTKKIITVIFANGIIILLTLILVDFRYLYILATLTILATCWFVRFRRKVPKSILISIILLLTIVSFSIVLNFFKNSEFASSVSAGLEYYNLDLANRSDGLSQKLFSLPFPWIIFGRLAYASITPLPILYNDWEWTFLGAGSILQFFYFPFVFLGVKKIYKLNEFWPLLVGFWIIFVGYVFGTFTFRHLVVVIPFASLLAVIGYTEYKSFRSNIWIVCLILLIFASFAYFILKYVM